jgi:branched-chain amino acid transport system permease protein
MNLGMLEQPAARALPWAAGLLALALVPFVASRLTLFLVMEILIFGITATSLNLLIGYGRMVSFGHAAWFGLGAYGAGITLQRLTDVGIIGAMAIGILVTMAIAAVVGFFCVRRGSIYFAMLTLAFAQLVMLIVLRLRSLTGGEQGLTGGVPRPAIGPFDMGTPTALYWLIVILSTIAIAGMRWLLSSPFGLTLRALAANPERAEATGVDVQFHQWLTFVIAAGFAAIGGGLHSMFQSAVFAESLMWTTSAVFVIMSLIGGVEHFGGPMVGAIAYIYLEQYAGAIFEAQDLVLGLMLIAVVIALQGGIVGGLSSATRAIARRFRYGEERVGPPEAGVDRGAPSVETEARG